MKLRALVATTVAALLVLSGCAPYTKRPPIETNFDDVAILVLDEFDHDVGFQSSEELTDDPDENCAYTDPSGKAGSTGAGNRVTKIGSTGAGDESLHGPVVYDVVVAELEATPGLTRAPLDWSDDALFPPNLPRVPRGWTATAETSAQIALVPVHVTNFSLEVAASKIVTVIEALKGHGYERFVLNMSFVVVPCDAGAFLERAAVAPEEVIAEYRELVSADYAGELATVLERLVLDNPGLSTSKLLAEMLDKPEWGWVTQFVIVNLFYRIFDGQPAAATLRERSLPVGEAFYQVARDRYWTSIVEKYVLNPDLRVIPVAAAGNGLVNPGDAGLTSTPLTFPFAPALWSAVTSVSASGSSGSLAGYSNWGEVMMDGDVVDAGEPAYQGTSFAAPRLAARQAIYLLTGGDVPCGGRTPPPLSYADLITPQALTQADGMDVDLTWPEPGWLNLPLATAVAFCPEFADHLAALTTPLPPASAATPAGTAT